MNHDLHIHSAQTSILRELLFKPVAGFAELQKPTGLSSDHFNFHISRLVELKLVEKVKTGCYSLTPRGKEFANKLDTDDNAIERQPKVTVLLAIHRQKNKKREFLFQERLKHPYYGYWGFATGKIRWGETVLQAAARELMEETGLQADLQFNGIYHEHAYQAETDELLEDKLFFVVTGTNPSGVLLENFEGGHNEWLTIDQMEKKKVFGSYHTELDIALNGGALQEEIHRYKKTEF